MSDLVLLTDHKTLPRVATLTLNRPEQRNALSLELLEAAHARLDALTTRLAADGPTVLLLTGAGKSFCAGMDLKQVIDVPGAPERLLTSLAELTIKLRALPCVTVSVVNGAAIGGGCGLAMVTDLAITHADAKLGFPEVDLGLCPAVVTPWVVRKVGPGRARAVLLRGGTMTGADAAALGLADEHTPDRDSLDQLATQLAERLSEGGPHALRATKGLLNDLDRSLDATAVRRGAELSASVLGREETRAALRARFAS